MTNAEGIDEDISDTERPAYLATSSIILSRRVT